MSYARFAVIAVLYFLLVRRRPMAGSENGVALSPTTLS